MLAQAVEAEVSVFLGSHAALVDAAGRRRVVRNGYLPERFIQTGIGPVSVRQPRVRDRGDGAIRFTSAILPRYLRRAKSLEDLLPWLYLKGISTGDFGEALAALLGSSAPGLSASTITRLKEVWGVEAERWQRRDLTAKRYVYFWVDGIYFSARMEEEKQCILVIVGATDKGQKELIAIADGYRESEQSWLEVLLDLKRRGLEMGPQLALGVNGGAKRDHRGGVRRDHLAAAGLSPSPWEGPGCDAACPQQADAAARAGVTCGPTGSSVGWVVGSVRRRGLTPAALVEPVALAIHLEDVGRGG